MLELKDRCQKIADLLDEKKAENIEIFDVTGSGYFVDAVVVAGAESLTCFGFYIRVTALVIAMLGFAGTYRFDNGLIAVFIQADKNVRR